MNAIIFDTETTGMNEPEIISAAWQDVHCAGIEFGPNAPTQLFFLPSKPIELGALATHHILLEDLEWFMPSSEFRLPDGVEYIIGWNPDYDWNAAGQPDVKRIDLCCIARRLHPGLDSYSQTAVYYHLFGATNETRAKLVQAHDAATDVINCGRIFLKLVEMSMAAMSIEEIWQFSEDCRIPDVMPFSKEHKGKPMSEVPEGFRNWYRRCTNPPPDPYILAAFEKYPTTL